MDAVVRSNRANRAVQQHAACRKIRRGCESGGHVGYRSDFSKYQWQYHRRERRTGMSDAERQSALRRRTRRWTIRLLSPADLLFRIRRFDNVSRARSAKFDRNTVPGTDDDDADGTSTFCRRNERHLLLHARWRPRQCLATEHHVGAIDYPWREFLHAQRPSVEWAIANGRLWR